MQELVQRVMEGYQKYAAEKGYTDPDKFGEYLAEYLQTEEAKEIMNTWQQEIFGDTVINITSVSYTHLMFFMKCLRRRGFMRTSTHSL